MINCDREVIAQRMAIVRFVAKKVGLAGKTDLEFAYADMIVEHVNDFMAKLAMMVFLTFLTHPEEKSFAGMDNADRRAAVLDSRPLLKGNLQRVMEVDEIALYLRSRSSFKGL